MSFLWSQLVSTTKRIGFLLLEGCHDADLVNMQALFAFHAKHRFYCISHKTADDDDDDDGSVLCQSGLALQADTTLEQFLHAKKIILDVLIIVGFDHDTSAAEDTTTLLKQLAGQSHRVVAVGPEGVLALAQTGLLQDHKVRCGGIQPKQLEQLKPLVKRVFSPDEIDDDEGDTTTADDDSNNDNNNKFVINAKKMSQTVCQSGKYVTAGPCTGAIEAALLVLSDIRDPWLAALGELSLEYVPTRRFVTNGIVDSATKSNGTTPNVGDGTTLKVGVLLTKYMYLPDVIGALAVFQAVPNTEIVVVVEDTNTTQIPTALGPTLAATDVVSMHDCPSLDVVVLGAVMPFVLKNADILHFLQIHGEHAKAMIGVCAGSLLLGAAGLLQGRRATTNFQMKRLLPEAGVTTNVSAETKGDEDEDMVVVDGKYYTSGPAIGSYEAALMVVEKFYGTDMAAHIEESVLCYHPNPPFGVGRPQNATASLLAAAKLAIEPLNPLYRYCTRRGLSISTNEGGEEKDGAYCFPQ